MKTIILTISIICIALCGIAQKTTVEIVQNSFIFGKVDEGKGIVSHNFIIKNTGNIPLIITGVKEGCNCIKVQWDGKPIPPGRTTTLKTTFNPSGRPGAFIKSFSVFTNTNPSTNTFTVRGFVVPRSTGPFDDYQTDFGPLKFKTDEINLGSLTPDQVKDKHISFINASDRDVSISAMSPGKYIQVLAPQTPVKAGKEGQLYVKYNAALKNDWGVLIENISLDIDGEATHKIPVKVNIKEDFSEYADDYSSAPVANFETKNLELGNIPAGQYRYTTFFLQNDGKSDLIIHKISISSKVLDCDMKRVIKPGKKIKVTIKIKAENGTKEVNEGLKIITNDPINTTTTIHVHASVI